tara:strand:+ start:318 stop:482 length:165 start_codon:yes stop_codon:yes gene_type:complete
MQLVRRENCRLNRKAEKPCLAQVFEEFLKLLIKKIARILTFESYVILSKQIAQE